MLIRILLAVEGDRVRSRLNRVIGERQLGAVVPATRADLWKRLNREDVDLVLVERELVSGSMREWVAAVRRLPERPEVAVVVPDHDDPHERAALVAAGCVAVIDLGLADGEVADVLAALVDRRSQEDLRLLRGTAPRVQPSLQDFVSQSPAMQQFLAVARRVVDSESSLLILGETGTGKERLARTVHQEGPRSSGPFLAVNCGALPETLLESELFGHEQGAFTGASRARRGYFELAHRGTLFLDEIGEMPLHLQVKLLRVLEDRKIQRVGGERSLRVEVRVMAATNRDLEEEVRARRFRADLYYRLAVVTLAMPPLRERREDIPSLVDSYLRHFSATLGRQVTGIDAEALGALMRYSWPGNVRELINVLERSVLLSSRATIGLAELPRMISGLPLPAGPGARPGTGPVGMPAIDVQGRPLRAARREALHAFTRAYLEELLRSTHGRVGETARRAGINPRSLYDLMRRHGLKKEQFR